MRVRRVKEVHQFAPAECALCCIAMILSAHGSRNSVTRLRREYETGRDGLTIKETADILRGHGMEVRTFRASTGSLRKLAFPLIAYWNDSHLVVLEKLTERRATVVDPSGGRRTHPVEEFEKHYSGLVMEATPTDAYTPVRHHEPSVWWEFLRAMRGAKWPLIHASLMSLLLYVFTVLMPMAIEHVINHFARYFTELSVPVVGALLLLPMAGYFAVSMLRSACLASVIRGLGELMMGRTFRTLLGLPYKYFANRSQGELMFRLSSIASVRDMLSSQVSAVLLDVGSLVVVFGYIFIKSVPLGLLAVAVFLCMVTVAAVSYRPIRKVTTFEINETTESSSLQMEALSSIETLKVSGMTDSFFANWQRVYAGAMDRTRRRIVLQGAASSGHAVFQVFGPLLVLAAGLWLVWRGRLDLGTAVAVQAMTATSLGTVTSLSTAFSQFVIANAQVTRVADILHQPPVKPVFGEQEVDIEGAVSLRGVGFSYPGARTPALRDVTFDVRAGQSVAVVGSSGSGKSTLGKLLMGLYPVGSGGIDYDGVSIGDIGADSFYRRVAYVPQEIVLSNRTIAENIAFGVPDADPEAVQRAARQAQIHQDVEAMPLGYATQIREMGGSLSGGQRQRVALARALIRQPRVLVLDEATSALDTVTESRIAEALAGLKCTRIIIAHRLSTIMNADLIVVLQDGRVVQTGRHHELVALSGPYRDLVHSQVSVQPV
ncbi:peptidase domain-containing ABC transporter [Streptomyces avidinii]|uniref:ABC-type bacteriocin/lantibiotic exporter with double-glycine peptidase domain n=1 Tax=Streptomyces avidinii TaxID=1895 RepID=A0ABS4L8Y4_STRAV|nr:peptidase domain-containing ABC transporter [Streptomyces avidinii]MBP2038575.1 ABC-type bacteriocin/lantibiotic exporter with double-glycine peptidase domain [Streptomyces avidinii]GGZ23757.1 peptidase C39 [Streptomyces avidinii]